MQEKTVLITGGSSGIGLDLAKAYAALGNNIILVARNQAKLDNAAGQCEALKTRSTQKISAYSVDVSQDADIQSLAQCVSHDFGAVDLVILSAGVVQNIPFMQHSDADFTHIMHTNVMGSRAVLKHLLPAMIEKKHGHICFVSSLAGIVPVYGYSAYSASKFAILGMAGALKQELYQQGIGVSVLCPPEVDTPMVQEEAKHVSPQARFVKDIAGTLKVDTVTKATIRGINKKQFLIIPGFMAKLTYMQARLAPEIFSWVMQCLVNYASKRAMKK
ncbi:MAG: SDR family NAD(P)-dependent oxidoreductase [Alteromonadaceae bacterium]|nr:SDR family NAD(P)-dependent oxidoreductase [Alteromonadaceae bacterium]